MMFPSHDLTVPVTGYGTTGSYLGSATSGRMIVGSGQTENGENLESLRAAGSSQASGSTSSSTVQPYIVAYMWERTS